MTPTTRELVQDYWRRMGTNDWQSVATLFASEFVLEWPQTGEKIVGGHNFAALNEAYPSDGKWAFFVETLVCDGSVAVTDTAVTDGSRTDRCVTFFWCAGGAICRMVEYWPEPSSPGFDRKEWVEPLTP